MNTNQLLFLRRIHPLVILIFMTIFSCQSSATEEENQLQVILCIGQSNMAGRAEIPPEDTVTLQRVYLFNDQDQWEPAKNPLNRYSTIRKEMSMQRLGPSWTFAQSLTEAYPESSFGLVVNVRGGTSINSWGKGSQYYNEALIKALKAQREGGNLIGVIWHQGEGDRDAWEGYSDKFADMIGNLRKDLAISDLPVVIGEIGDWKGNSQDINREIIAITEKVPRVACVSVDGLGHMGDTLHFNADAQHELGRRYAEKFREMVQLAQQ